MSRLALLQSELKDNEDNLKEVEELLLAAPGFQDAVDMKTELLAKKEQLEKQIVEIRPAASASKTTDASPPPATEKWSKENHPAFRKNASATPAPVEEQKAFAIGDTVSAKYSADKAFYPANIISITGSSAAPIYTIKFKGYNETATVRAHEIRAIPSSTSTVQKRKADGSPVVSTPAMAGHATTPTANGSVISAAANIDSALANAIRKEPSKVSDGPARPERIAKKVKTKNALEKSKNNWKDWQAKGSAGKAAKVVNKESMFRTGEAHTARVGFTGSGQSMRKDVTRVKHTYQLDDDE